MSYTQVATRTTDDANSHADINQLQLNIEALKGGLGTDAPVTTIDALNTWKTDFGANVMTELNATGDAPLYACRAWVNFTGTGTVTKNGSGNVGSITDNGTGQYTINFTTEMQDTNYAVTEGSSKDASSYGTVCRIISTTTSAFSVSYGQANNYSYLVDQEMVFFAIFR